jgi:hypothetical protein
MTLNLDTSTPIRTLARYRELVTTVLDAAASTQETQWLEWKRAGDASEKKWRAELSKQVLGFANREPDVAAKWCGGCAYVLVGVAPTELNGSPVHDAANIESWLTRYVGHAPDGPEWHSSYVDVRGVQVLVLTIEPPRWGDRIWVCHKDFVLDPRTPGGDGKVTLRDGGIYVRHDASTEEANRTDIAMLERRLAGSRRRISDIALLVSEGGRAVAVDANSETVAAWAQREREALEPPPPPPPRPVKERRTVDIEDLPPGSSMLNRAKVLAQMSESVNAAFKAYPFGVEPDRRTREDYAKEVDEYIAKATNTMPAVVLRRTFDRGLGRVVLLVQNQTDDPVRQLQIEIYIPAAGVMAFDYADVSHADPPKRPVMLGKAVRSRFAGLEAMSLSTLQIPRSHYLSSPATRSIGRGVRIDNSGSVRLTFDPVELFPRETVDLPEVHLFAPVAHAGTALPTQWTARSRDASGVLAGTFDIDVDARVPTIDELLAESDTERDEPQDEE